LEWWRQLPIARTAEIEGLIPESEWRDEIVRPVSDPHFVAAGLEITLD